MAAYFTLRNGTVLPPVHVGDRLWATHMRHISTAQLDGHELEKVQEHFPWIGDTDKRVVLLSYPESQLAWAALASEK